jgi:hypothetical protein
VTSSVRVTGADEQYSTLIVTVIKPEGPMLRLEATRVKDLKVALERDDPPYFHASGLAPAGSPLFDHRPYELSISGILLPTEPKGIMYTLTDVMRNVVAHGE